jgi:hypothetical protein
MHVLTCVAPTQTWSGSGYKVTAGRSWTVVREPLSPLNGSEGTEVHTFCDLLGRRRRWTVVQREQSVIY